MTRVLTQSVYSLLGVLFLVAGGSVLLLGTGLLPDAMRDLIVSLARDNDNTLHIMQEFSALLVFVGLITFWFVRHYEASRPFHWAMTAFWGLIALVHWIDIRGPVSSMIGPAINSIPFAVFVLLGLLRWGWEGRARGDVA
jgi:hypothetical protein